MTMISWRYSRAFGACAMGVALYPVLEGGPINFVPAALATTALHFVPGRDLKARDSAELRSCLLTERRA